MTDDEHASAWISTWTLTRGGIARTRHASLVRWYDSPPPPRSHSLVDLSMADGPWVADEQAEPFLAERTDPHPVIFVTARFLYHLPRAFTRVANPVVSPEGRPEPLGVPVYALSAATFTDWLKTRARTDHAEFRRAVEYFRTAPRSLFDTLPSRLRAKLFGPEIPTFLDFVAKSEEELLRMPGVGLRTLRFLDEWVRQRTKPVGGEVGLDELRDYVREGAAGPPRRRTPTGAVTRLVSELPPCAQGLPTRALRNLLTRARGALDRQGIRTIGDLAKLSDVEILEWPNFTELEYSSLRRSLGDLRSRIRELLVPDDEKSEKVFEYLLLSRPLYEHLEENLAAMDEREREVLTALLLDDPPSATMAELAERFRTSVGEVKQMLWFAGLKLDPGGTLIGPVEERLAKHRAGRSTPLTLAELQRAEPWFARAAGDPRLLRALLKSADRGHLVVANVPGVPAFAAPRGAADVEAMAKEFARRRQAEPAADPQAIADEIAAAGAPELAPLLLPLARTLR